MNKILIALILIVYIPIILSAGYLGVYSHFYSGILIIITILLSGKLARILRGKGYIGYIIFVVLFDVLFETCFYVGGFTFYPNASLAGMVIMNAMGWFVAGTIFYIIASKFNYGTKGVLIIPAIMGIMIENVLRLGMYPIAVSLALMFLNGVNYSVELGLGYWLVKGYEKGRAKILHYVIGIIVLYIWFWVFILTVVPIFESGMFGWTVIS